jgi:hypothetical protein
MLDVTRMLTAQIILHVKIDSVLILALLETLALQVLYVKSSGMSRFVHALMVTLGILKLVANCHQDLNVQQILNAQSILHAFEKSVKILAKPIPVASTPNAR